MNSRRSYEHYWRASSCCFRIFGWENIPTSNPNPSTHYNPRIGCFSRISGCGNWGMLRSLERPSASSHFWRSRYEWLGNSGVFIYGQWWTKWSADEHGWCSESRNIQDKLQHGKVLFRRVLSICFYCVWNQRVAEVGALSCSTAAVSILFHHLSWKLKHCVVSVDK